MLAGTAKVVVGFIRRAIAPLSIPPLLDLEGQAKVGWEEAKLQVEQSRFKVSRVQQSLWAQHVTLCSRHRLASCEFTSETSVTRQAQAIQMLSGSHADA